MKTLQDIKDDITAAKASHSELDQLNSTSKVSIWALIRDTVAVVVWTLYKFFEQHKKDVQAAADKGYFGSAAWFADQIRAFQFGYILTLKDGKFVYDTDDPDARIVQQVALETLGELVNVKVAKLDGAKELTAFTEAEKDALKAYIDEIKFPGTFVNVISQPADKLNLTYRVYYNALRGEETVRNEVESILHDYLQSIVFNGVFDAAESIDQVQEVNGVVSPYLVSANGRPDGVDTSEAEPFSEFYFSAAGYMKIENLTLEMIPS